MTEPIAAAADPDRLIEGEDPHTTHAEDARHWLLIYGQLLAYKEMVFARTEQAMRTMHRETASEIERTDLAVMRRERERIQRRLDFWRQRLGELGGAVGFDRRNRLIQHPGGTVRLSRREAELFAFLFTHPEGTFRPDELAAEAWGAPSRSAPQVRNYVVRLRRKLSDTRIPCDLISDPGMGYRLKWHRQTHAGRPRPRDG